MDSKKLESILERHVEWIQTRGRIGSRAIIQGKDLTGFCLSRATLNKADLSGCKLLNLLRASLQDANLSFTELTGACLDYAWLKGADLKFANLRGASLYGAHLGEADLRKAIFGPNFRKVGDFAYAKVCKNDLPWLALHPRWSDWHGTLEVFP